ncbi:hypothetical protein [Neopusillimonas aromaticivorans]|uniref:hypothetical protein n=1 Tax=Neopusillimonas aromaticivorans TaxID=2979868 RepID=UPI0025945397|nr:hypothetical protein [Neopusillimonas aromaticivorans]WJJ92747.1 hypothetical protein N7E01_10720 [Neopusillimonas aromaticivorans]
MTFARSLAFLLRLCLVLCVTGGLATVRADQISSIEPVVKNGQLYIDADIDLVIDGELREAAEKGVPFISPPISKLRPIAGGGSTR